MKLVRLNATPFAKSLKSLLGTVIRGHPDAPAIQAAIDAGTATLHVRIDQAAHNMAIGAILANGEKRLIAAVDMGLSPWPIVYPDWNAEPPPIDAVLH